MVSLKIECPCGQHYAFEVEPVMGRMPAPIACPACGANGTDTANEILAQSAGISPKTSASYVAAVGVEGGEVDSTASSNSTQPRAAIAGTPPSRHVTSVPGLPSKTQVLFEARAKISWGDSPQEVLKYMMIQGFTYDQAAEAVREMMNERAAAIRQKGFVYICGGVGLMYVPIITWLGLMHTGARYYRFLIVTIFVGLGGIGVLIKGIFMFVAPSSSGGDVAEQ